MMFSTRKVAWDDIEVGVKNHGHWCPDRLAFWNSHNEESHRIRELMDGNDLQSPGGFSKPSDSQQSTHNHKKGQGDSTSSSKKLKMKENDCKKLDLQECTNDLSHLQKEHQEKSL